MLNMINGFEQTDSDCLQCIKSLGDREYSLIRVIWLDTTNEDIKSSANNCINNYVVVADKININEFSREDIEAIISSYYASIEDMENKYNMSLKELDSLVAECIFEESQSYSMKSNIVTWDEAEQIIQKFIDNNGKKF